ncbi:MAG: hypothetical protein WBM08_00935, partial [Prochlorococcaceae cyanobacterium]
NLPGVDPQYMAAAIRGQLQPPAQQQPVMPMPAPGGNSGYGFDGWSQFSQAMDVAPQDAWKVLDSMNPQQLRTKVLFLDS